jgi:hypothetical protein
MFLDINDLDHYNLLNVFRELSFPFPSQRMTLFFSLWEAPWANCK